MPVYDISIIKWRPLPAPLEHFVLIRWFEFGQFFCREALSLDGRRFVDHEDQPINVKVGSWAFLPYDMLEEGEDPELN